jgi:hypothetical protein
VRGRLIALLLVVGTVVPTASAFASVPNRPAPGSGSIGIRLVPAPGALPDNALARSYVVDRLAPGMSIRRGVEIDNNTRAIADISVYPAAASVDRGSFAFNPGHGQNELSSWTSVSSDVLRLAPGTAVVDTLTISVPAHASRGEHYAVVWAEVSAPPPAAGGVTLVNRVGVRIYVSIGPGGAPPSNFAIGSLTAARSASGEPLVVAQVHNSGETTLDISGKLTLSNGPGGLRAGPFAARSKTVLAPGVSETVTVPLDSALPRGPWRAALVLTSGLLQRSAVATITFPFYAGATNPPIPGGFPRLILLIMVLLVVLVIAAVALLVSRRHGPGFS